MIGEDEQGRVAAQPVQGGQVGVRGCGLPFWSWSAYQPGMGDEAGHHAPDQGHGQCRPGQARKEPFPGHQEGIVRGRGDLQVLTGQTQPNLGPAGREPCGDLLRAEHQVRRKETVHPDTVKPDGSALLPRVDADSVERAGLGVDGVPVALRTGKDGG